MVSINPMSRHARADLPAQGLRRQGAGLARVAVRRGRPGRRARHRRAAGAHHQRAGVPDPGRRAAVRGHDPAAPRGHDGLRASSSPSTAGQVPPPVDLGPDDVAFLTYTSGTTGVPKGAMNTHRNVVFTAQVYRDWVHAGRDGAIFGIAPLFHITGLIGHIAVSLLAPAPLVLAYRFEPQVVLDAFARAPADVHDRRDHGVQRAAQRAGVHQGPLRVVHLDLLRRRGDLADRRARRSSRRRASRCTTPTA